MTLFQALRTACVTALGFGLVASVHAQPVEIDWSGVAWFDYAYTLSDDDPEIVGSNSFNYRRLYLTADADLNDDVRARVRLEAQGRSTTGAGQPVPFVKDAWVRWQYSDTGHRATIGVQPPPLFQTSEATWGYRSLERTLVDRFQSSRDLGIRLDGPLALDGDLRYAAMVGNGRGIRLTPAGESGKHVYGKLIYRPGGGSLRASLGADYVAVVPVNAEPETGPEPERESGLAVTAFVGTVTERFRGGVEGFLNHTEFDRAGTSTRDTYGVSVFAIGRTSAQTSIIARYDFSDAAGDVFAASEHLVIAGVSYRPAPRFEIIPNVLASFRDGTDPSVAARATVTAQF